MVLAVKGAALTGQTHMQTEAREHARAQIIIPSVCMSPPACITSAAIANLRCQTTEKLSMLGNGVHGWQAIRVSLQHGAGAAQAVTNVQVANAANATVRYCTTA